MIPGLAWQCSGEHLDPVDALSWAGGPQDVCLGLPLDGS